MTTALLHSFGRLTSIGRQSTRIAERNIDTLSAGSWLTLLTGFFEPLFYLLAIGVGLGSQIGEIPLPGGATIGYAAFVAPAMVASCAMSSALAETTFVFVGRLRYLRVYDAILNTPVRPVEVALGELGWATVRVCLYAAGFLAITTALGYTTPWRAIAALPAAALAALAFGCAGILAATLVRDWQDFDALALIQFALFLFSGTFVPVETYPTILRLLVEITPLSHAVALVRALTTGSLGATQWVDTAYLLAMTALCLTLAARRIGRLLRA